MPDKPVTFTASSARSGTTTLSRFFRENVPGSLSLHEPDLLPRKYPSVEALGLPADTDGLAVKGFAKAIHWYDRDADELEKLVDFRARVIHMVPHTAYFEANHAFVKSLCDGLVTAFPAMRLVHLARNPLEVARSTVNRWPDPRLTIKPFHLLEDPDTVLERFGNWNVSPGLRKNVLPDPPRPWSVFQLYIWAWLEVEMRTVRFREKNPEVPVFDLRTDQLDDRNVMAELLAFVGAPRPAEEVDLPGANNQNTTKTAVTSKDRALARTTLRGLPEGTLEKLPFAFDLLELRG